MIKPLKIRFDVVASFSLRYYALLLIVANFCYKQHI